MFHYCENSSIAAAGNELTAGKSFGNGAYPGEPLLTFVDYVAHYSRFVIKDVARIRNCSAENSIAFIARSSFEDTVKCLRSGRSLVADMDPGMLSAIFGRIGTVREKNII